MEVHVLMMYDIWRVNTGVFRRSMPTSSYKSSTPSSASRIEDSNRLAWYISPCNNTSSYCQSSLKIVSYRCIVRNSPRGSPTATALTWGEQSHRGNGGSKPSSFDVHAGRSCSNLYIKYWSAAFLVVQVLWLRQELVAGARVLLSHTR